MVEEYQDRWLELQRLVREAGYSISIGGFHGPILPEDILPGQIVFDVWAWLPDY